MNDRPGATRFAARLLAATLLASLAPTLASGADATLSVSAARSAPPLPGTNMMAGYLTLTNSGGEAVTVTGATSADFERVSLHRSVEQDGQSRMEPVDAVSLEPGAQVAFEPGGLHLMLFHPAGEPKVGDTLTVHLQSDAGAIEVPLRVVDRGELLSP